MMRTFPSLLALLCSNAPRSGFVRNARPLKLGCIIPEVPTAAQTGMRNPCRDEGMRHITEGFGRPADLNHERPASTGAWAAK